MGFQALVKKCARFGVNFSEATIQVNKSNTSGI